MAGGDGRAAEKPKLKMESGLWPYAIVNSSYLLYTITDGAVRMIVLLHAFRLSFTAMEIAVMFTLYEAAGVVTNLLAGVVGARWGIKATLVSGLTLHLFGLGMLLGWDNSWQKSAAITYVTLAQMLCGIAKDLVKLGGKTVSKLVTPDEKQGQLFQLVAMITGWKNSLKGCGYFLGSVLLLWESGPNGFYGAIMVLMGIILLALPWALISLSPELGRADKKNATLAQVFALPPDATAMDRRNQRNRNWLSLGRCFLFAARDCWFEVPLPLYLRDPVSGLGWSRPAAGAFLGGYIIVYGQFQAHSTLFLRPLQQFDKDKNIVPHKWHVVLWALFCIPSLAWLGSFVQWSPAFDCVLQPDAAATSANNSLVDAVGGVVGQDQQLHWCTDSDAVLRTTVLMVGVSTFAFVFGINSAVNSGLIAAYSTNATAAKNIGFCARTAEASPLACLFLRTII